MRTERTGLSDVQRLVAFAKSDEAIKDPFTAMLAFELLRGHEEETDRYKLLSRAFFWHPRDFQICWKLAIHYRTRANRLEEGTAHDQHMAEYYFSHCVVSRPRHQTALMKWSHASVHAGNREQAISILKRARENCPEDPRANCYIARRYLEAGDSVSAEEYVYEGLGLVDDDARLGHSANENSRIEKDGKSRLPELDPNSVRLAVRDPIRDERLALKTLAQLFVAQGNTAAAEFVTETLMNGSRGCDKLTATIMADCAFVKGDVQTEIAWLGIAKEKAHFFRVKQEIVSRIELAELESEASRFFGLIDGASKLN